LKKDITFVKVKKITMELADLRRDFGKYTFIPEKAPDTPMDLFNIWLTDAEQAQIPEFNAMALSTASVQGRPSSRIVLLKSFEQGLPVFFTNYESKKGHEIASNNQAALLFFWKELERQVRIEGRIEKLSRELSVAYFKSRPMESQLSAAASPQSQVIFGVSELIEQIELIKKQQNVLKCPENWGGYVLTPDYYEFWQGGANRLHHRLAYLSDKKKWIKQQLAP